MDDFFAVLQLIGGVQALLLFVVLRLKKENRLANRVLSYLLLFAALDMMEHGLAVKGYGAAYPWLPWDTVVHGFLYGPLVYLYTSVMLSRITEFSWKNLLHFLPFVAVTAISMYAYYSIAETDRAQMLALIQKDRHSEGMNVLAELGFLYEFVYFSISIFILHGHRKKVKLYFSDIRRVSLTWLMAGILVPCVIEVLLVSSIHLNILFFADIHLFHWLATIIGMLSIFAISIMAMLQPEIFTAIRVMKQEIDEPGPDEPAEKTREKKEKYRRLKRDEREEEKLLASLQNLMETEKPYLDETLTLKRLADSLGVSSHAISMALNLRRNINFYSFVNAYRIQEVIRLMADPGFTDANVLRLAYEVGFNSKSTFNAFFKKQTGSTPTEYRERLATSGEKVT